MLMFLVLLCNFDIKVPLYYISQLYVYCVYKGTLYDGVDFVDERHRHRYEVCLFAACGSLFMFIGL